MKLLYKMPLFNNQKIRYKIEVKLIEGELVWKIEKILKLRKNSYKSFFIKLASISVAIVIIVNLLFNLIFAERLEKIDKILLLDKSKTRSEFKHKLRNELSKGLEKDNMIAEEDKILLYKLYLKIKEEFKNLDKSNL